MEPTPPTSDPVTLTALLAADPPLIYHERQSLALCAVHALNNLFCNHLPAPETPTTPTLERLFTKEALDQISVQKHAETAAQAKELGVGGAGGFFNPHRSVIPIGNFDVVVIETAVRNMGYSWTWFDARKGAEELPNLEDLVGIVVTHPPQEFLNFAVENMREIWGLPLTSSMFRLQSEELW